LTMNGTATSGMASLRCKVCNSRVRPPTRAWAESERGGVHFYKTNNTDSYVEFILKLGKKLPVIHELCAKGRPELVPPNALIALNVYLRQRGY
jgi:hypothetical protein